MGATPSPSCLCDLCGYSFPRTSLKEMVSEGSHDSAFFCLPCLDKQEDLDREAMDAFHASLGYEGEEDDS